MESISSSSADAGSRRRRPVTGNLATAERSPLADLTNVAAVATSPSASFSSSLLPLLKSNHDPNPQPNPKCDTGPDPKVLPLENRPSSSVDCETPRGAGDEPGGCSIPTPSTPKPKKAVSIPVDEDCNWSRPELSVVYTRRTMKGKNSRKKQPTAESSCPPLGRNSKRGKLVSEETDANCLKACSVPYQKPKKRQYELPKDFIEKQKAYFDEIDAFELPEEVVSETELD